MIHHGENEADRLVPSSLLLVPMYVYFLTPALRINQS